MSKPKLMIVDDSEIVLEVVAGVLRDAGFEVVTRSSSVGTSAAILRERPALVLLDVSMPLIDGAEIATSLRSSGVTRQTKVVLHSDRPRAELERLVQETGADGFVRKTGDLRALVAEVRTQLERVSAGRSGTQRISRPILVASSRATQTLLRSSIGARTQLVFTDSGTEVLRLICSPTPPPSALVGTSLSDLPAHVVWRSAVERDASWRERLVIIDEPGMVAVELPGMRRWSVDDSLERLAGTLERLAEGS
ncbi:MAG: response regulator [Sandaracinaceae bacterium]|nr:response regulator [Sandaracinaceae bacterium]